MSVTHSLPDASVRSSNYYVARTFAPCSQCGLPTGLLALAVPETHEVLDSDGTQGDWQRTDAPAFLFYIEQLSAGVRLRLEQLSPCFRPAQSVVTQSIYWANHCEHCGTLLDDYELHCEPSGAFSPSSQTDAAAIELSKIDEPFEAAASGYSPAPEFFRFMRPR